MIKYARQRLAGLSLLLCLSGNAAAAIPVIDPAALVKFQTQIVKMIEQINLLNKWRAPYPQKLSGKMTQSLAVHLQP